MIAPKFVFFKQMEDVRKEIDMVDEGLYDFTQVDLEKFTKNYRGINYQNTLKIHSQKVNL